jgi:hypothetical protein
MGDVIIVWVTIVLIDTLPKLIDQLKVRRRN